MKQLTLVLFKPDATLEVQKEFLNELQSYGLKIEYTGAKFIFTPKLLEEHYGHIRNYGPGIFEKCHAFLSAPDAFCTPMVISGDDAIAKVRKIIGPTRMATWGIRKTSESARVDSPKNYIHASGNEAEAAEEIARFFPGKKF